MEMAQVPPPQAEGSEAQLVSLRTQLALLVGRLHDDEAGREVERRFDVLAAEIRSDVPLVDVARAAGTGLIVRAARWEDIGGEIARTVGQLLASLEPDAGMLELDELEAEEVAAVLEPDWAGVPLEPPDEVGGEGIGPPVYPPGH